MALLRSDLVRAETLGIPILVQVDTENWLPTSLLNWYDPALPGYNPAKKGVVCGMEVRLGIDHQR